MLIKNRLASQKQLWFLTLSSPPDSNFNSVLSERQQWRRIKDSLWEDSLSLSLWLHWPEGVCQGPVPEGRPFREPSCPSDPWQAWGEMLSVEWLVGLFQVWVGSVFHQHPDTKMWINSTQILDCVKPWKPTLFSWVPQGTSYAKVDLGLPATWVEAPDRWNPETRFCSAINW